MLILASASPRRKEILQKLGYEFSCEISNAKEEYSNDLPIEKIAEELAVIKATDVFNRNKDSVVIGADTIVVNDNKVMGKPQSENDACQMLRLLSGKTHTVYTGVCVISKSKCERFTVASDVIFTALTEEDISWYISTGEPMDKAGAYGIQGLGCRFISSINGDFYSVMGLPAGKLYSVLKEF